MDMQGKVEELCRKRASTLDPARPHAVQKQKDLGKLTVRRRLELLCDP
jgi:acetyl-CoA carboxylase carboxyltransferase component